MHRRRGQRPVCGGASQSWRKELRNFVAQAVAEDQATFLGKAAMKEPWTQNAGLTKKRSMRFGSSTREWPGVSFFFLCRSERSGLLHTKENDVGMAALLTRVEGRPSTEGQLMLSFITVTIFSRATKGAKKVSVLIFFLCLLISHFLLPLGGEFLD